MPLGKRKMNKRAKHPTKVHKVRSISYIQIKNWYVSKCVLNSLINEGTNVMAEWLKRETRVYRFRSWSKGY